MHFAQHVPGHVCGLRFTQDKRCYDSGSVRFLDYAKYGNDASFFQGAAGAPAFSTHGTYKREGVLFDNSFQLQLVNPIPWEGTMVVVGKVHLPTTSKRLTSFLFGDDFSFPFNNGSVGFLNTNPNVTLTAGPPAAQIYTTVTVPADPSLFIAAFSWDEQNRKMYGTLDAVTVNASAAQSGTDSHLMAPGAHGNVGLAGSVGSRMLFIGNNACATAQQTTADATDYLWLFQLDFFKRNPLVNNLAEVQDYFANLKAYYGIA